MTRALLSVLFGLGLAGAATAAQAADVCLRSDRLAHISMKDKDTAIARDKDGGVYHITFSAPCGARHNRVFFVLHPQDMPLCIGPGAFLPTNSEAACEVTSVRKTS